MLMTREVEAYLAPVKPELRDIALELRSIIVSVAPQAVEEIHAQGMSYHHPGGGTVSAGICQIFIKQDHIRLAFIHGAFLPDRRGMLEGNMKAKRYIRIASYEDAPWDYLKEMISASARFDPYTLSMS